MKRPQVVILTQTEYAAFIGKVNNPALRYRLKVLAHAAMYGNNPDARVFLPKELVEACQDDQQKNQ